jgi:hypothetical protein
MHACLTLFWKIKLKIKKSKIFFELIRGVKETLTPPPPKAERLDEYNLENRVLPKRTRFTASIRMKEKMSKKIISQLNIFTRC